MTAPAPVDDRLRVVVDVRTAETVFGPATSAQVSDWIIRDAFWRGGDLRPAAICDHTRAAWACARETAHPGWHRSAAGEEWPQYAEDRDLDAILGGDGYQAPAIELTGGAR